MSCGQPMAAMRRERPCRCFVIWYFRQRERLTVLSVAPQSMISGARPDPAFLMRITPAARRRALLESEDEAQEAATHLDPSGIELEAIVALGQPHRGSAASIANVEGRPRRHGRKGPFEPRSHPPRQRQPGRRPELEPPGGRSAARHTRATQGADRLRRHRPCPPFRHVPGPAQPAAGCRFQARLRRRALLDAIGRDAPRFVAAPWKRRRQIAGGAQAEAERALSLLADSMRATGRRVETVVLTGAAGPRLDEAARDLRRGPARRWLAQAVARRAIISSAPRPKSSSATPTSPSSSSGDAGQTHQLS